MKKVRMSLAVLVLLFVSAGGARTQEMPKPGPEHELLKKLAGQWDAEIKLYMKAGEAPQESKGEYKAKLDVGGFFITSEFKGKMFGDAPFHGRGLTGYDPNKKKYVGVWVDSMGPTINTTEGTFDESGKVFTETMTGVNPQGKPMKMRLVTEIKDKDHQHFKIYGPGEDGKEFMVMEIAYSRKK